MIPNHYSASLSELDLTAARCVPPGGNWKNIPSNVPLKRLSTIRDSYARGEGSRSTYYGRLRPDRPAYTINTYFNRPGNGCHLHYDYAGGQHRVLSQREAARLQSFPDSFIFSGSKNSINIQIGNAVPPLLGYVIARQLGEPGLYVDLFAGAGGLSLGFRWARWRSVVANDIVPEFLRTYAANVDAQVVAGDLRDPEVLAQLVDRTKDAQRRSPSLPLWVLGGPPCQGFSTAGNRRSMNDQRNLLFHQYIAVLRALRPDGFVFENVTGLLNMDGGRVLDMISACLREEAEETTQWLLSTENYAIPQRRRRVVIVGHQAARRAVPPPLLTQMSDGLTLIRLSPAVTVNEAIGDLPPLQEGEDGSHLDYTMPSQNAYQRLMRGELNAQSYIAEYEAALEAAV